MNRRLLLSIFASFLVCFLLNYFFHHDLLVSLINSLTLILSIYLFQSYLIEKKLLFNSFLIVSLGLTPLFHYKPNSYLLLFLPILSLSFFKLYEHFSRKWVIIIWIVFLFFGHLFSGEIIKYPFYIQDSQLIFNSPEINYNINRHQRDALFIPFSIRELFYSKTVFVYALLNNFFDFLNLKNLFDILLIANLYPLSLGAYNLFRKKNKFRGLCLGAALITILAVGIDRSADKFQSLYILEPLFVYLIVLGTNNINKKLYLILWILSLSLILDLKI